MLYPLAIAGVCTIASILGTFFVKLGKNNNIMIALYKGFFATAVMSLIILYPITDYIIGLNTEYYIEDKIFTGMGLYVCGIVGFAITGLIIFVTEYYTGTNFRPVQSIASLFDVLGFSFLNCK